MNGTEVERKVCSYAREIDPGIQAYKFTSPERKNVPDRIFVFPGGQVIFVEFKANGESPTKGQRRELIRLHNNGCYAYSCNNITHGQQIIDYWYCRHIKPRLISPLPDRGFEL